ncbi:MAG: hypothetical protein ABEL51_12500, partial [Salinibacter sp.]
INAAISVCHEAGGGRVVIPEGNWKSGTIRMASNVDLHIEDGATVHFVQDVEAYLPPVLVREEGVESYNLSPLIYAREPSTESGPSSGRSGTRIPTAGATGWPPRRSLSTSVTTDGKMEASDQTSSCRSTRETC